ncbi:MAG: hypothetical protein QOF60_1241 [Actinomycetota bacterium]|jgi:hypothetical protein|nr:hypothetical protein [Actinomycetota bacterium]
MKIRKVLLAAVAGLGCVGGAFAATPASASTSAYFVLTGGSLSISEPSAAGGVNLGGGTVGLVSTVSGSLGPVTVTDNRALLLAAWQASVSSTEFVVTTAGPTPAANEKVALTNITYVAGLSTAASGGAFSGLTVASMALPDGSRVAGTFAGSGANSATWNPTIAFSLLSSQVAGKYTGSITHSVA